MKKLINERTGEVILEDLQTADTFYTRFLGLMGRPSIPENSGLMIKPCKNQLRCSGALGALRIADVAK